MSSTLKALLTILVIIILVPIVLIVMGYAGYDMFRMGWVGSNFGDHISFSYAYFDGHETSNYNVSNANTLIVDYAVTVEDGSLDLQVINLANNKILWERKCDHTVEDQVELNVASVDRVQIRVIGHETKGNFTIRPIIQ